VNIDKVAYKEVNFKSKLLEWTQKNRVRMEFRMLQQAKDEKGSPVFGFQVMIEGVEGSKGQGYSKKEAQQLASKATLERLRREPQFIDAIFAAKSERTKMEEEPTMAAPDLEAAKTDFIIENANANENAGMSGMSGEPGKSREFGMSGKSGISEESEAPSDVDEFDLSDITHNPAEQSREDIIAAAEAAAYE